MHAVFQALNVWGKAECTFFFVEPADAASVVVGFQQEFPEELPQMDGLARAGRICL